MVTEFFENEKMVTTLFKAKELRPVAEKMITLGKQGSLHARRRALAFLRSKSTVFKLFDSLAPRFADRNGGYTRILRLGARPGDAAEMALIEFVDAQDQAARRQKEAEKKEAAKPKKKEAAEAKSQTAEDSAEPEAPPEAEEPKKPRRSRRTKSASE
jgi:large subunit ribosomal protein L17